MPKIPYQTKYRALDFLRGAVTGRLGIQRRLYGHLRDQAREWPKEQLYTRGYFYQGMEELSITGAKPTGFRFRQYQVDDILQGADVLDIGSNCGFVAAYCAKRAKHVTAIELNPYLNRIARDTATHLGLKNIDVVDGDFAAWEPDRQFDVALSFSNHHTIDGNLDMGFANYLRKISDLLRPGGYLLFESHNVFAAGTGGVGDDGDMEAKVAVMNRWFTIERYRMVHCFLEHAVDDLDKLFIVARKSERPEPCAFSLPAAIKKYNY
jgi:SAM-dependent methyltransferase